MLYLKLVATCQSPTALKRPGKSKQCHCLQFGQSGSMLFPNFLKILTIETQLMAFSGDINDRVFKSFFLI